jgi:hypothetical protein
MTLEEKLGKIGLSEIERERAIRLFAPALSMLDDSFVEVLSFLKEIGIEIKYARDIKLLTVPMNEIQKKYNLLKDISEIELLQKEPKTIAMNVISIIKRIQYCIQNNIEYKVDGKYADFILNEGLFNEMVAQKKNIAPEPLSMSATIDSDPNNELTSILKEKDNLAKLREELEKFSMPILDELEANFGGRAA